MIIENINNFNDFGFFFLKDVYAGYRIRKYSMLYDLYKLQLSCNLMFFKGWWNSKFLWAHGDHVIVTNVIIIYEGLDNTFLLLSHRLVNIGNQWRYVIFLSTHL